MSTQKYNVKATYEVPEERDIVKRLNKGEIIIGDGGFVFALEKRGYVKAGPWTPEAVCEHPDAVKQLHREFLRSGSDVMQTFTFYASDDKLSNRGNDAAAKFTCKGINAQACKIAREVAEEGLKDGLHVMVTGGISQTPTYLSGGGKEATQEQFRIQVEQFVNNKVDFLLAEYYVHIEETEWAIEACLESGLPVAASMCIGPEGDLHGNSPEVCAVRMANAGAKIIGINCHFGPVESVECMRKMSKALEEAGLKFDKEKNPNGVHMMCQPLCFLTPDAGKQGFIDLPEFPFGLESRICTRWDMHKFARDCHDIGVNFIGGCCGFEPYHIRACADELSEERGRRPLAAAKWIPGAGGLAMHTKPWVRARANKAYWDELKCASGRPNCPCVSKPMNWGVTQGSDALKQQTQETTQEELDILQCKLVNNNDKVTVPVVTN